MLYGLNDSLALHIYSFSCLHLLILHSMFSIIIWKLNFMTFPLLRVDSLPCSEVFLRVFRFPPSTKNQNLQIQPWMHGHLWTSIWELFGALYINKLHFILFYVNLGVWLFTFLLLATVILVQELQLTDIGCNKRITSRVSQIAQLQEEREQRLKSKKNTTTTVCGGKYVSTVFESLYTDIVLNFHIRY